MQPTQRPEVAWSFSSIEMYRQCPRKYWAVKIQKVDDTNKFSKKGDDEHAVFDRYLRSRTPERVHVPDHLRPMVPMLDRVKAAPGELYSEYKMALNANYVPCDFKDWNAAFVRAVLDVCIVNGERAKILDWKTGKVKDDPTQLELASAVLFRHFPSVKVVDAGLVFIHHSVVVPFEIHADEAPRIWGDFLPTVNAIVQSMRTDEWPTKPSPLCGYCPYKACQFNTAHKRGF